MKKGKMIIAAAFCLGVFLAAGSGKNTIWAEEYNASQDTDITWEDAYLDDTSQDTTVEKQVYEYYSGVLSDQSVAKGISRSFSIKDVEDTDWYGNVVKPKNVSWKVEGKAVTITSDSTNKKTLKVKGKKTGEATISVTYDMEYDSCIYRYTSTATIYVTNPKLASKTINLNKYDSELGETAESVTGYLDITGCNDSSTVTVTSSSKKVTADAYHYWWNDEWELQVTATKKGNYKVKLNIDGKRFTVKVNVYSARFKCNTTHSVDCHMDKKWHEGETMLALYKGATEQLTVKGLKSGTKIKWKSSNKKVATVNQSGVVRAKGNGYCTITAKFAGGSITYEVGVASKAATKAVYYAIKHFGSEYSQENRMAEGKYDCSSYIYRAYKDAGVTLGTSKNWAPTAAELGKWCTEKGYVLYTEDEEVDVTKLRPGDLIFETGENNGRYKGIYHVDLYTGNFSSLTVERTKYYGETMTGVIIARPCP
jgi:cell wall-associated NlpC family hydrolase